MLKTMKSADISKILNVERNVDKKYGFQQCFFLKIL